MPTHSQLTKTGPLLVKMKKEFYERPDTVLIATELLGKLIVTNRNGSFRLSRICETEAYCGVQDQACHAYNGKMTKRTQIMYEPGGVAYVYICYGIHHLLNIVTHEKGHPHVVLIRAAIPILGIVDMTAAMGYLINEKRLTSGPGNLTKAMGISIADNGLSLEGDELYLADDGYHLLPGQIAASTRIGLKSAGTDASLPYRFYIQNCTWVSSNNK
jgi:DNA-3-methyladenine glycosylase